MYSQGVIPEIVPSPIMLEDKLDINSVYRGDTPALLSSNSTSANSLEAMWNKGLGTSLEAQAQPTYFDWDKTQADRYVNSPYINTLGFDPNRNNEAMYGAVQSWGNTMGNALAGSWNLAAQTFTEGWKGWGNMANALFNWNSESSFSERLMGTPEELMEQHKAQEAVFNKYAIFSTPESEKSIWNRQFLGNLIQQSGFALGAGAQFAMEELLTAGAAAYLKPFTAARAIKGLENTGRVINLAENTQKATRIANDFIKEAGIAEKIWEGTKRFVPIAGSANDAIAAYRNGEGLLQAGMIGLGGVKRGLAEYNMAATEARFEAAGTYGSLYGDLYDQYVERTGKAPEGAELERIQNMATSSAWDNFRVNTGILMVANRIQFDGLLNKFSSSRSTLKNVANQATSDVFQVSAEVEGKQVTRAFNKGRFGKLSAYSDVRRELGSKTANLEAFKNIMKGAGKWEVSEGGQELLQETSNAALTRYYTDLYNGKDADLGTAVETAAGEQLSMQGLKTFLMGAVTGRLISPLSYAATKTMDRIGTTKDQRQQKKDWVNEQKEILNSFYSNIPQALNEAVASTKVGNRTSKTLTQALKNNDRYQYNNDKETLFARTISAAIKTNMLPSLTDTLRDYGNYFTNEEWKEAYGDLGKEEVRTYVDGIAGEVEAFANRWDELKDKFGDLVIPESVPKNSKEYKILQQKKAALDAAIEVLATADYMDKRSIQRANQLLSEVSANKDFGSSANQAFRVLGNKDATAKEIQMLQQEVEGMQQLTERDEQANLLLADKQQQLKHLTKWAELNDQFTEDEKVMMNLTNKLLPEYRGYINSVNKLSNNTAVINQSDLHDSFWKLSDYRDLYDRHREMLNAFNTLVDPKNFQGWVLDIENSLAETRDNLKAEHEKELEEVTKEPVIPEITPVPDTNSGMPSAAGLDDDFLSGGEESYVDLDDIDLGDVEDENTLSFDGQSIVEGQPVWDLQGRKYTVKDIKDGQLRIKGDKKDLYYLNDLSKHSLTEILPFAKKTFQSISELSTIYPHREPGESVEQAKERFSTWLGKVDIEKFKKGAKVVVSNNDKFQGEFPASADNPYLSNARGPLTVQIQYQGKPVGYLTQPEMATLLDRNGQVLTVGNITQDDFDRVYQVDTKVMSPAEAYNNFMQNKRSSEAVRDQLMELLGDKQKITLSAKEVEGLLNVQITGGGFNWAEDGQRTPLKQLQQSTAKVNDKRFSLIVDRFQDASESGPVPFINSKYKGEGYTLITDAEEAEDQSALGALWNSVTDKSDNLGRYVAVVSLDNGNTKVLELAPQQMSAKDVTAMVKNINSRIQQTKADNLNSDGKPKTNVYNEEFNDLLNQELFISPARGYFNMKISPVGKVQVEYSLYMGKKEGMFRRNIPVGDEFNNVKDGKTLAAFLNTIVQQHDNNPLVSNANKILPRAGIGEITTENFKQGIPHASPTAEQLRKMDAKVDKDIASRNWRMVYSYSGELLSTPETQRTSAPAKAVTPSGKKVTGKKVQKPSISNPTEVAEVINVQQRMTALEAEKKELEKALMAQYQSEGDGKVQAAKKAKVESKKVYDQKSAELAKNAGIIDETIRKVVGEEFDAISAGQVTEFRNWAVENLPDFIEVSDIQQLEKNLLSKGVTVGSFIALMDKVNNTVTGGRISVAGRYGYHEAFHGVFRLLLSDTKIAQLLSIARGEAQPTRQKLQEFQSVHPDYQKLSTKALEDRYLEEYLADKFQAWMENKKVQTSATIKGFFAKLWEWIKNIFTKNTPGELEALFSRIDQGGFRQSNMEPNRFTAMTEPVYKLIEVGNQYLTDEDGNTIRTDKYLPAQKSAEIATNVASLFQRYADQRGEYNKSALLDEVLDKYAELYDVDSPRNTALFESIVDDTQLLDTMGKMEELFNLYTDPDSRRSIKEAADFHLNMYGYRQSLEDESMESMGDDLGDRGMADQMSEKETFGGFDSMSRELKRYIASLTPNGQDEFGNQFFDEQQLEAIPQALNVNRVYTGTLKSLKDTPDKLQLLDKIQQLSESEGDAGTFAKLFLQDANLYKDENGGWVLGNTTKANTVQLVLNGFNQFNVTYSFLLRSEDGDIIVADANQQNMVKVQVSAWEDGYLNNYLSKRAALSDTKQIAELNAPIKSTLGLLQNYLTKGKITEKQSQSVAQILTNNLGIALTPEYIRFSVAASAEKPTAPQQKMINLYGDRYAMTPEDIGWISRTFSDNLFRGYDRDEQGGATGRIIKIASGNAQFDERVDTTSFKNAEGNTVQSIQLPTYHLVMEQKLKDEQYLNQLATEPFLQDHPLLEQMRKGTTLDFFRASGTRTAYGVVDEKTGQWKETKSYEVNRRPGVTYGHYGPQEFTDFAINQYNQYRKVNSKYLVPSLIRVLEASNTGDFARMPVVQSVKRVGEQLRMTDEAINLHLDLVQREFNRVKYVMAEEAAGFPGGQLEGYHYAYKNGERVKGRGYEFFGAKLMLEELGPKLLAKLADNPQYELSKADIKAIKEQVENYRLRQARELLNYLREQQLIATDSKGQLENRKLGKFVEEGLDDDANVALNLVPGDLEYNMTQIYINDVLNTTLINQVLRGDEATGLKDAVDAVKRAKAANGGGSSLTAPFAAPELGISRPLTSLQGVIIKEPNFTKRDGTTGDKADGQTWVSSFAYRHILYGLGKLNPKVAAVLDKIDSGEPVTQADIFNTGGLVDSNGMFLPQKLAYYDGRKMVKTSVAMIPREMVSYKDNKNRWQPLPGRNELHTLLNQLETAEKSGIPAFAGPQSAFKQEKRNVASSIDGIGPENFTPYDTDFWRLQLENPSNKLEITDPTQLKQILVAGQKMDTQVAGKSVKDWIDDYFTDTAARVTNSYTQARNELFDIRDLTSELQKSIDNSQVTPKLAEFQDRAVENLIATGADSQLIGFFRTKNGEPVYDLNGPHTLNKYTQLFLAYFSTGVMGEKIPGHSLILMSNYGLKIIRRVKAHNGQIRLNAQGVPMDFEVIPMSEVRKDPRKYQSARVWDDASNTGSRTWSDIKEGDLLIDDLRHDLDELDAEGNPTGIKYSEIMMPPHYREYMDKKPGELGTMADGFGVRIPTQDKSSFTNTKVVDFLPAYLGSTIVGSQELIEISGADFDVDKLYLQVPDTYRVKDGNKWSRKAFGTATTDEGKFLEYISYLLEHDRTFRKQLRDISSSFGDANDLQFDTDQELIDTLLGSAEDNMPLYKTALLELGLPATVEQFKASGIVNKGELNNRILQQKRALFTNPYTVENGAYTTVDTKPLQDLAAQMATEFQGTEFARRLQESPTETNDLQGKIAAFTNNKVGSRGIGPIANALLVYSLLNTFGVKFRDSYVQNKEIIPVWKFKLDDKVFDGYSEQNDIRGGRIASTISLMVSMMVDNAKERLAAKFGLNMESLGQVANLVGQGVPFETAVLFINQPIVQEYFTESERNSGALTLSGQGKEGILAELMERELKAAEALGDKATPVGDLSTELLKQNIKDGGSDPMLQYRVLQEFKGLRNQSTYFSDLAQVVKIVKGLPSSFEELQQIQEKEDRLGLNATDAKFAELGVPFDLRSIMNSEHKIMATYRSMRDQIMSLSKSMFIERTPVFGRIMDVVKANTYVNPADRLRFDEVLKKDLIAYLAIKGYKNMLVKNGRGNRLASVDNSLIYNTGEQRNSVLTALEHVREVLPDNYIATYFMNPISAENETNRDSIDKIEANTWSRLSELQTEKMIDSFMEIYQNADTRADAWSLFHYLLVKDGGLYKSNSYIKYVPNVMFKDLLDSLTKGRELMAAEDYTQEKYEDIFGDGVTTMYNEFVSFYLQHFDSKIYIPSLYGKFEEEVEKLEGFKPQSVQINANNIEVDLFKGIREIQWVDVGQQGIIPVKVRGKFSEEEKQKLQLNRQMLGNMGFNSTKVGSGEESKSEIVFPLVVKRQFTDEITGRKTYEYYRLSSVGKTSGELKDMISQGQNTATGVKARYELFDLKGARGTFRLSEMNGELPANIDLYKKPESTGFDNIDYDVLDSKVAAIVAAESTPFPRNYEQLQVKLFDLGITHKMTREASGNFIWEFSGGAYENLTAAEKKKVKGPQDLFAILKPEDTVAEYEEIIYDTEDEDYDEDQNARIPDEFDVDDMDIDYDAAFDDPGLIANKLNNFTLGDSNPLKDECA